MKKRKLLILSILLFIVIVILVMFLPRPLTFLIPTKNITTIEIENKDGVYDEETGLYSKSIETLSEKEEEECINKIKDGWYRNMYLKYKMTSKIKYTIHYEDGSHIEFNEYLVRKYDNNNNLVRMKRVWLMTSFDFMGD